MEIKYTWISIFLFFLIRNAVRDTWGSQLRTNDENSESSNVKNERLHSNSKAFGIYFVLGRPKENEGNIPKDQIEIEKEGQRFGDILQIDIEETYHNCFYKGW